MKCESEMSLFWPEKCHVLFEWSLTEQSKTDNVKPGQIVEGQHLLESIVVLFVVDNKGSQQSLTELSFQNLNQIEPV